jgi:hypothetical protein
MIHIDKDDWSDEFRLEQSNRRTSQNRDETEGRETGASVRANCDGRMKDIFDLITRIYTKFK